MSYFYSYLHFLAALIYGTLAALILIKDAHARINQTCAAIFIFLFVWSGSYVLIHHPATTEKVMSICENISSIGWIWFTLFFMCFCWMYARRKMAGPHKVFLALFVIIPVLLTYQQWTHYAIVNHHYRTYYGWMYEWNRTPWLYTFFGYYTICVVTGMYLIFNHLLKSDNSLIRRQSFILAGSGFISLVVGSLVNVVLPLVMTDPPVPIADVTTLVWGIGLAYVAIRYRMLDITPIMAARSIIAVMKDLLFLLDTKGMIISVNPSTVGTLGYGNEWLGGMPFRNLVDQEDVLHASFMDRVSKVAVYSTETTLIARAGNKIPVALSTSTIPNVGIVCVAYDISLQKQRTEVLREAKERLESEVTKATAELQETNEKLTQEIAERKMAALALMETEQRFKVIFENAPDGIFLADTKGNFIDANKETLRIIGYEKKEIIGRNIFDLGILSSGTRSDEAHVLTEKLFESGTGSVEVEVCRKDGESMATEIITHPVTIDDYNLVLAMVRDLSLRNRMEKEKVRLEQELHHAQKMDAVGRLAGGIAHDFNNLLAGIMGYADIMRRRLAGGSADKDKIDVIRKIIDTTQQASNLTAQLLAFARKGKYSVETVDLRKIIEDVIDLLEHSMDRRISVVKLFDEGLTAAVKGDRSQLQSALLNLGLNARDALPEGGTITFTLRRSAAESDESDDRNTDEKGKRGASVEVTVEDDGVGMNQHTRSQIFEPFFTTKKPGKGTGLGLASVYGTVKLHRGSIDLWSEQGKGTRFTIRLPLTEEVPVEEVQVRETTVDMAVGGRILVVDDEDIVREMVKDALNDAGHSVTTKVDGNKALEWFRVHGADCDLVLLDMTMPGLNGVDCFRGIRSVKPEQKVILVSGHAQDCDIDMLMNEGANAFLQKPFKLNVLEKMVDSVLANGGV
jgi:PAS domain S-box-containing protein